MYPTSQNGELRPSSHSLCFTTGLFDFVEDPALAYCDYGSAGHRILSRSSYIGTEMDTLDQATISSTEKKGALATPELAERMIPRKLEIGRHRRSRQGDSA